MKTLQKPKLPHSPGLVLTTIVLMTVALVQIFPFYWMLTFSLKSNADIYGGNIAGLPTTLHFENYVKAFTTGNIGVYLKNSVIITLVTIAVVTLLACMASYAMLRMEWKFQGAVFALFLLGYMIPMHATLLPLMKLLGKLGLLDSRLALIFPLHRVWATVCNLHFVRLYARDPAGTGGSGLHRRLQHIPDLFPRYHAAAETGNFHHRDFYVSERMERIDVGNDIYQRRFQKNADLRDHEF